MNRPGSTALGAVRRRLRAVREGEEQGAALLTVIMLMFIVGALSVLVLGTVVSQLRPTKAAQESTRTVFAAEAGLQSALNQIKTSTTSTTSQVGSRTSLPCSVQGSADGTGGAAAYTATITYFVKDPTLFGTTAPANAPLTCTPGGGPVRTPGYAVVRSAASDTAGSVLTRGRTLQATYTFNVVNANVAGGQVMTAQGAACLQADSATAGSQVRYVAASTCSDDTALQQWVYDTGYHIALASTVGASTGSLCITRPALGATPRTVTLETCTLTSKTATQLWSYEGGAKFRAQDDSNTGYAGECLWSGQYDNGAVVGRLLASGACGDNQDWGAFLPEARVGAGAASMTTRQLVNFQEFGRCADVTNENVSSDRMIVYPCKQDPTGKPVFWNHRWLYGAETGTASEPTGSAGMSTRLRVLQYNDANRTYCLTTPLTTTQPSYPSLQACNGSDQQRFTRYYNSGNPLTSYTFVTSDGRCLSTGPRFTAGVDVSTIVATTCSGGTEQKWNAPPNAVTATVTGQGEVNPS